MAEEGKHIFTIFYRGGDNYVLERYNEEGKPTSARPATLEEWLMFKWLTDKRNEVAALQKQLADHTVASQAVLERLELLEKELDNKLRMTVLVTAEKIKAAFAESIVAGEVWPPFKRGTKINAEMIRQYIDGVIEKSVTEE